MDEACTGFIVAAVDRDGRPVVRLGPGLGMGRGTPHPFAFEREARDAMVGADANAPGEYSGLKVEARP